MTKTLVDLLQAGAKITHKGYTFLDDELKPTTHSFSDMTREAERRARLFRSLGLEKGDRVALIVPEGEDFILTFFGAVRAGLVPVPMFPPLALGKLDAYVETAARVIRSAGAKLLVTTKQVAPVVWSLLSKVDSLEDLMLAQEIRDFDDARITASLDGLVINPEDPAFLQFTSGSTSDPKGVIVSHENLMAQTRAILDGLRADGSVDRGVSWLPLYHDMGLIGFVIAPYAVVPVVFIPTLTFVKRPHVWMTTVAKYKGTITFAPNFAFGLAAKRATPRRLAGLDLSGLRVVGCGAEPINAETMRRFTDAFAAAKLPRTAIMPCYGMAEATLAISFADTETPPSTLRIKKSEYEEYGLAVPDQGLGGRDSIELVSCGDTFIDHEVQIMNGEGKLLPEGEVGEIVVRGPSITSGYFENPKASVELLRGGWMHTGDLGFFYDGELYISGRQKDLIILNGKNYHPQAFEWEIEQIDGIRKGNVVAFSRQGENSEELVLVAEHKRSADTAALSETIRRRIHEAVGVRVREVVLVEAGCLPKTSSGKLQRRRTKQIYESGELGRDGNRTLGSTATKVSLARHITKGVAARVKHTIKKRRRLVPVGSRAESR